MSRHTLHFSFFFFNDTATTEIYTLSLHDALPISSVTNTINAYWELAYAHENVKVQQQAVAVSEKLYSDNKKQLEIGTMAPLDVTRAESELATNQQNLIVAQTVQLTDEQT